MLTTIGDSQASHLALRILDSIRQSPDGCYQDIVEPAIERNGRRCGTVSSDPVNQRIQLMVFQNYYCAYVGAFGEFSCNPRTLGSIHLNRMISLEGIVTKCSLVRPKIIQSVHYSEKKDRFLSRRYRDQTMSASGATSLNVYPQEDDEKNPVCSGYKIRQVGDS